MILYFNALVAILNLAVKLVIIYGIALLKAS